MNYNAYDNINPIKQTWISPKYKTLYSRIIPYKPYYTILKRYNKTKGLNDFYLVITDNPDSNLLLLSTGKRGDVIKFKLSQFWNNLPIKDLKENLEISFNIEEQSKDSIIYYLDI